MAPFGLGVIPAGVWYNPKLLVQLLNLRPWEFMDKWSKVFGDFYSVQAGGFYAGPYRFHYFQF